MIKVQVYKKDRQFTRFDVIGHAGFATHGTDIICASVSAIAQTAVLGLIRVANIELVIEKKQGLLKVEIPRKYFDTKELEISIVIGTMLEGIRDLQKQFPKHINLEEV